MPAVTGPFAGKAAIVTGGASGIGRAMGAHLAAEGAHVVLADLDGGAVREAATAISGSTEGHELDVRERGSSTRRRQLTSPPRPRPR